MNSTLLSIKNIKDKLYYVEGALSVHSCAVPKKCAYILVTKRNRYFKFYGKKRNVIKIIHGKGSLKFIFIYSII